MQFQAKDGEATIWIYDAIGEMFGPDAVTAKGIKDKLQAFRGIEKITLRINSPGGVVDDATAIHTLLSEHPATKVTKVDGIAASAATILIPPGRVEMAKGAKMMIHNPWTVAIGNWRELEKAAAVAKVYSNSAAEIYAARTGKSAEDIMAAMDAETYFTAQDAVDFGLADGIGGEDAIEAASHDDVFAKAKLVAQLAFAELVGKSADSMQQTLDGMAKVAVSIAEKLTPYRTAIAKRRSHHLT